MREHDYEQKQKQLLQHIQELDFTLYDLRLYLDTHPSCPHALAKFQHYNALKQNALEQYNSLGHSLSPEQSDSSKSWNWVQNPWPWEKEAN